MGVWMFVVDKIKHPSPSLLGCCFVRSDIVLFYMFKDST